MAQVGAPYRVVDGTLFLPWGNNGMVLRADYGSGSKTPVSVKNVSGPDDGGSPVFSPGNYQYRVSLRGHTTEGKLAQTSVTYTHATKTLSKTGAFSDVAVGESVYVSGGTGATAGWYEIATNADDDTVTLVTAPGDSDQTDFAIYGLTTLAGTTSGTATIQFGNGETWSGSVYIVAVNPIMSVSDSEDVDAAVSLLFSGDVTITTGAV